MIGGILKYVIKKELKAAAIGMLTFTNGLEFCKVPDAKKLQLPQKLPK
ncbi:hypothetical protein JCM31826_03390 [Thermaurantimonas aggregans]|uniref:Uncharacterized protein n=1 Tax=Thermaurantimonas aggregans TaxID=2173829 RepID=A0A401XIJ5_9FLAO|nr:hypothetical protein JCM31826_03390 [Thermaurantimonas aggregans]